MATMNISIPDSMKAFIEQRVAADEFTTSEYFRYLVRKDQDEWEMKRRAQIAEYLALCEQQMANGEASEFDVDEVIREGEKLYKQMVKRRKKSA